jgi:hypothetical protein
MLYPISRFKEDSSDLLYGYIDAAGAINTPGEWLITPRYLIGMSFSQERAFISIDGESFRLIDLNGSYVTFDVLERARPFRAGLAPVRKDGRWGSNRCKR